ncbi:hypothetical protein H8356DRAFT_955145 [Neocallimastix lanati (nom. inval.)]|nr:hypothetical protein H8356DRAFT_955145 [Neocallimastix sp. JGI-2020a]
MNINSNSIDQSFHDRAQVSINYIQLLYFIIFDKDAITVNDSISKFIGYFALDNIDYDKFFMHSFSKSMIPKDGVLVAFPDVSFLNKHFALFGLSILIFFFFLIFQIFVSLIINLMKGYFEDFTKFIFIFLFLYMIYGIYELIKTQPYYNKPINYFRSGTWTMILGMTSIRFISLIFGKGKSIFSILLFITGAVCFVVGILLCHYCFKKHINFIYKSYKDKKMEDIALYNLENGITSSSNHSSGSRSVNQSEEKLISFDSENSDETDTRNEISESEDTEDSGDSDEVSSNDSNSFAISDRVSERITSFSSLRDIGKFY